MSSIKQLPFLILMMLIFNGYSQENRGKIMINGNGNFLRRNLDHSIKVNDPTTSTVDITNGGINLNIGYFMSNRFALGLTGGLGQRKTASFWANDPVSITTQKDKNTNYSGGIFVRYNQPFGKSKFGVFLNWSHAYQRTLTSSYSLRTTPNLPDAISEINAEVQGYISSFTPGLFYFISNRVSLELNMGTVNFESYKSKNQPGHVIRKEQNLYSNFSIYSISFGVTFYLGKGKSKTAEQKIESKGVE